MKKALRVGLFSVAGLLIFVTGAGVGGAGSRANQAAEASPVPAVTVTAQPAPAPTVTVTSKPVEKIVEKPVEKIVEKVVEKTPKACLTALDREAEIVQLFAQYADTMQTALQAAFDHDAAGMTSVTAEIKAINAKFEAAKAPLASAVALCRAH